MDLLSKSDSILRLYSDGGAGAPDAWNKISQTESYKDNNNPSFSTPLIFAYVLGW